MCSTHIVAALHSLARAALLVLGKRSETLNLGENDAAYARQKQDDDDYPDPPVRVRTRVLLLVLVLMHTTPGVAPVSVLVLFALDWAL